MSTKRTLFASIGLFALFMVAIVATNVSAEDTKRRNIKVGQQISISASGVQKYSEGQKGIVDIRLPEDGQEFIIVGVRPGNTTMLLIKEDGLKVTYFFEVKALTDLVPAKENIKLDFYFVELKEGGAYQVGVNWPGSIGVDAALEVGLDSSGITGASASLSGLPLPRLDVLQSNSWAKIARQASVVSANGEEAEFNSGGEVNIAIQGSQAAELRQIPFGTKVKVLPRYDQESGRLELRIQAEVSSLGEGAVPARSTSNVSTVVNVEMNQAIVLAGLYSETQAKSREGLPFLSQLPVIGALFGSHGARQERVQNMVFIVPSIVNVVDMDARSQIRDALDAYENFSGELGNKRINLDTKTKAGR